ncbi:NAD-dependent epimerase/dehydratase family protein [Lysobacter sp. KIS68-7]|uniref:NAD-dependent epimerase/dehydratase family protein n=1 Tax=Lysobacter sp. KIS68-7 TaxID=2904252 RepID=UPI001E50A60E|nr:NAD-dependent epimerase/dehydratase family protein [Lysobacter sp. KIS68-7]UHQ19762.1 NAD-dependent epimerase/dehydratase family protein [Lysobacter sp. KIS68-7]
MTSRRDFLTVSLAAAGLAAMPAFARKKKPAAEDTNDDAFRKPGAPLRILVLGGTGFLGPHFVEAARAKGHKLTLFNRGKTNPTRFSGEEFKDIEQLQGDRKTDMKALEGRRKWDAVLDTSAYLPADVTRSAQLLAKRVDQYLLVSTISVYARLDVPNQDESAPVAQLADPNVTEVTGETYGGLKALCESAAQREIPGHVTVVRPGLIVGPGDTTDRFTYWPARADRGGEILGPGSAADPTQFIDVRDLAAFMLHVIEQRNFGTFNADAPGGKLTMGELLDSCQRIAAKPSTVTWVPAAFLDKQQVSAWQDMPVWIPAEGENAGFGRMSSAKAQAAGLTYRPLDTTVADTLAYWRSLPPDRRANPKAGLPPEREAAVLKAWHASLEPKPVKKSTSKKSSKKSSTKKSSSKKKKH